MEMEASDQSLQAVKQFMAALNCGASLIDRSGKVVYVNDRLCEMMNRSMDQIVGTRVIDLYTNPTDRARVMKSLENFDRDIEAEFNLPQPDGTKLPIISSARQLPGAPPLSDHRLVTMIDISKQKTAEKKLKEQYEVIVQMSDTLLEQATELKRYSQTLEDRVKQRTAELHEAHMDAIYMLAVASEVKDEDTGRHVRRIEKYTRELARRMGFSEKDATAIGYSAILHDIGKIHVPDDILMKPGPLDKDERARMQLHTLAGERIIAPNCFFDRARKIARSHHENWDGSGYPDGLSKDNIPIESRIVHVADVYDALTHVRVYKKAWSQAEAVDSIRAGKGAMFDPDVVRAFDNAIQVNAFETVEN
jgi:PAS domain S-box-containing protein